MQRMDSTKERIREVALDVFAERGFEGTSTREICSRAGVNGAALNYHWRSKEQLWEAVCATCGDWFAGVVAKVDMSAAPGDAIASFLRLVFDGLVEDPRPIRVVLWASMQPSAKDREGVAGNFRPFVDFGNVYLKALKAQGLLGSEIDTDVVSLLVHNMLAYTIVNQRGHEKTFGGDFSNPEIAARVREGLVGACLTLLGLKESGAGEAQDGAPPRKKRAIR